MGPHHTPTAEKRNQGLIFREEEEAVFGNRDHFPTRLDLVHLLELTEFSLDEFEN